MTFLKNKGETGHIYIYLYLCIEEMNWLDKKQEMDLTIIVLHMK